MSLCAFQQGFGKVPASEFFQRLLIWLLNCFKVNSLLFLCLIKPAVLVFLRFFGYRSPFTISPSHKIFLYFGTVSTPHAREQLYKAIITIFACFHPVTWLWLNMYGYPTFQRNYLLYYSSPDPAFWSIWGATLARLDIVGNKLHWNLNCMYSNHSIVIIINVGFFWTVWLGFMHPLTYI